MTKVQGKGRDGKRVIVEEQERHFGRTWGGGRRKAGFEEEGGWNSKGGRGGEGRSRIEMR